MICSVLNGISIQIKAKYLGLPLVIGRSKKEVSSYITEIVAKRSQTGKIIFLVQQAEKYL